MSMFLKKMKKNRKGYTLTELIVVVAILGILAAVATPMVLNQVQSARDNTDAANAKSISNAYKIAMTTGNGTAPADASGAIDLIDNHLNPVPTPQQDTTYFNLNINTGEVAVSGAAINVSPWFTVASNP